MVYRIPEIPAETIVEVAEALLILGNEYDTEKLKKYTGETEEHIRRGLEGAVQLGFSEKTDNPNRPFIPCEPQSRYLAHAHIEDRRILFKMHLVDYPPFRLFAEYISAGTTPTASASKVRTVYDIESEPNIVKHSMTEWGLFCDCFDRREGRLVPSVDERESLSRYLALVDSILTDENSAYSQIRRKLSDDCYRYVDNRILDNIAVVLVKIAHDEADKQQILFPLGTAFEGFLSQIAASQNPPVDLSNCAGITQMGNQLRSNRVITSKHVTMTSYVAAARNAAHHDTDPQVGEPWKFSNESIMDITMVTINAIRSVYEYCFKQDTLIF